MTIPKSPTMTFNQDLIHPLVECGYKLPWIDNEPDWQPIVYRTCNLCKKILLKDAPPNTKYCSVACRQMRKK